MKLRGVSGKLEQSAIIIRTLLVIVVLLGVALVANGMFRRNAIVHIGPPVVEKEYWVLAKSGNEEYWKSLTPVFLSWVTNVTPRSVDFLHAQFLKFVPPEEYGRLAQALSGDSKQVISQGISRVFWPDQVLVKPRGSTVVAVAAGYEKWWVGAKETKKRKRGYEITMALRDYQPVILDIRTGELAPDGLSLKEPSKSGR